MAGLYTSIAAGHNFLPWAIAVAAHSSLPLGFDAAKIPQEFVVADTLLPALAIAVVHMEIVAGRSLVLALAIAVGSCWCFRGRGRYLPSWEPEQVLPHRGLARVLQNLA